MCYAFFLLIFCGKIDLRMKCSNETSKSAVEDPIVLLVEIHKPEIFMLNLYCHLLQIIVEIGDKCALKPLLDVLEAKLMSKN